MKLRSVESERALYWSLIVARLILAVLWFTLVSCTSSGVTGGAAIDAGMDTGSSSAGVCLGDRSPNPDVATSCTPSAAKAGAACTQDCCVGCGIDLLGQGTCSCSSDKYAICTCPRPATWTALGGECGDSSCLTEGGPCSPQGYASSAGAPQGATILEGQPCVMNGNVCFSAESDGKHGCVCASDPSGDFVMPLRARGGVVLEQRDANDLLRRSEET